MASVQSDPGGHRDLPVGAQQHRGSFVNAGNARLVRRAKRMKGRGRALHGQPLAVLGCLLFNDGIANWCGAKPLELRIEAVKGC